MNKDYSRTKVRRRYAAFLSVSIISFAGLFMFGTAAAHAGGNTAGQHPDKPITLAQVDIRPGQSYVIKPKGPSQKELKDAAEMARKRRLQTAEQSSRYVVTTTDGTRIDCKTILRDKNDLILTTHTGKTISLAESDIKEIAKLQYYNGRLNTTVLDGLSDIPEKAETNDE